MVACASRFLRSSRPWLAVSALLGIASGCATAVSPPAAPASAPAPPPAASLQGELVDLTHAFDENTLYWPTARTGFRFEVLAHGHMPGGFFYAANAMCAPEHGGTHLDAPIHFAQDRTTADEVPLSRLVAPAVVIDLGAAAEADPDALLRPEDIEAFERDHGEIAPGTIVLVRTGWSARWPDRRRYFGDDTPGEATNLHFPGVSKEAAEVLVARGVAAVGIDTASIDHGPSREFWAHRVLLAADIPAFENVTALERLPPRGATVIALPMKIRGGSGGPLRIVAIVPR